MKLKTEATPAEGFEKLDAGDGDKAFRDKCARDMMVQGLNGDGSYYRVNRKGDLVKEIDPQYANDVGGFLMRNNVRDRGASYEDEE